MERRKPRQVRLCMNADMQTKWERVMKLFPDLSETQVHGFIMGAALRALEESDYRFQMPLVFVVGRELTLPSARR